MYPVNETIINLLQNGGRQLARIVFSGNNEEFTIDESDIVQGGLTIDRYCMTGNKVEIGSAISSELTLKLRNYEGNFDDVNFEGAELFVEIGVKDWNNSESPVTWIPCGYFIIDEPPRTLSTISVSALDRMVLFDHWVNMNLLTFPITIENLVKAVCRICGVTIATDLTTLPNYDYVVQSTFTGDGVTYRSIIQWCAFVMGTCAFMNYDGELVFSWFQSGNFAITPSIRYSSDLLENDIAITGLLYTNEQNQEYLFGTKDYAIESQSNILLQNNIRETLTVTYDAIKNLVYRPFTASIKSAPFLYPLDGVIFEDKNGNQVNSYVTHITYTLNGACNISAEGVTAKKEEQKITRLSPKQVLAIQQAVANPSVASQLITMALTGYVIIRPDEILIMDTDDTATATSVWRWNRGGLGYSHGEAGKAYDGVYSLAIGMNGQIVADFIQAGTMFADRIRGGTLVLGGAGTSGSSTSGAMSVLDENGNEIARVDKNGVYTENFSTGNWLKLENGALLGGETGTTTATIDTSAVIVDGDHGISYHGLQFSSDVVYFDCDFFAINGATGTTGYLNYVGDVSFSTTQIEVVTDAYIDGNGALQLTKATIEYVSGWSWYKTGAYFTNGIMCTGLENWATGGADEHTSGVSTETGGTGGSHVYPPISPTVEYTNLEYIQTTNRQFFNTGYIPNANTKIECEYLLLGNYDNYGQALFGSPSMKVNYNDYGTHKITLTNGGQSVTSSKSFPWNQKIKIVLDDSQLSWYSGNTLIDSIAMSAGSSFGNYPLWVGCINNSGTVLNFGEFRIYSFKIYANNNLVMDFVPVKRNSDGVCGMLNTLTNVFYPDAQGEAGFLPPNSEHSYQAVNAVQTSGNLYVDTGFVHTVNTKLVIDSIPLCAGTNGIIFLGSVLNNDYDSDAWAIWTRSQFRFVRGHSDEDSAGHIIAPCPDVDISVRCTITIENGTLTVTHADGTSETFTDTNAIVGNGIVSMYLFNMNTANSSKFWPNAGATTIFYSCQIYDNGVLVRDFIPVKRLSDNALMLYDRVAGEEYHPIGGTFTEVS